MYEQDTARIPYSEFRAIADLLRAHLAAHEGQMHALVAFGPLLTRGNTYDIDLLEVVAGWDGPTSVAFPSTPELPLRGVLRLHILTPEQFEKPNEAARDILERVRLGYEIIYDTHAGYAERVLTGAIQELSTDNPLTFLDRRLAGSLAA